MSELFTLFDPPPAPSELPTAFPNPFNEEPPHPLALRAATELQAQLPGRDRDGKMFGVLVVTDESGRVGYLRAFSGQLDGRWAVEGFAPRVFDQAAFDALNASGEPRVKELTRLSEGFAASPGRAAVLSDAENLRQGHAAELNELRLRHRSNREQRQARRTAAAGDAEQLHALDQESRRDKAERRVLDARQEEERRQLDVWVARIERRLKALERLRQRTSRDLMRRMHDTCELRNAAGESSSLRALFAPGEPPSGAADCAAPKLLGAAFANGWRPIALAEFWWGRSPISGGRAHGAFYPPCRDKCGPVVPFLLRGLNVAEHRPFTVTKRADGLSVVFEDETIVVIDKPSGILSVPSKDVAADSVQAALKERYPNATGPLLVHRLDLDTSGLLVAALDSETHAHLQRQFAERSVTKRYIAWVDGNVTGEQGEIDLPLRVDLNDRPRQLVDPVHGLRAVTRWQVLERRAGRTRLALFPLTGRTHQLRVHAAHPNGLDAPIVGDRLYGHPGERLLLHAEQISFVHPGSGQRVTFTSPTPF